MNGPNEENRFWRWEFIISITFVLIFTIGVILIAAKNGVGDCV